MQKVNLAHKFTLFAEHWSPKLIGELNGQQIKIAKIRGSFVWHHHEHADEFFLVVRGRITIQLPDRDVPLEEGEFLIVPHGVEHRPLAKEEAHILIFEPAGTLNTGNVQGERTIDEPERL